METMTVQKIQTQDDSYLEGFLRDSRHNLRINYYMTKLLEVAISRHLQDPREFSCPSLVEGRFLPAPYPFVQAVDRDLIPMGWFLSLDTPRSCQLGVLSSLGKSLGFLPLLSYL